jgi:hypothetical protein
MDNFHEVLDINRSPLKLHRFVSAGFSSFIGLEGRTGNSGKSDEAHSSPPQSISGQAAAAPQRSPSRPKEDNMGTVGNHSWELPAGAGARPVRGGGAQGACEAQSAPVIQEIQILCQSTK